MLRDRTAMIEQLVQVTESPVENILQSTVELIAETFNAGCCLSWQPQRDSKARVCYSSKSVTQELRQLCQKLCHSYRSTLAEGTLRALARGDSLPLVEVAMREADIDSVLLIPLLTENTYSGEISLYRQAMQWTENERQIIRAIASQCVRTIEQATPPSPKAQSLHELSQQIFRLLNSPRQPEQILLEILAKIGQGFQIERVVLLQLVGEQLEVHQEWRLHDHVPQIRIGSFNLAPRELVFNGRERQYVATASEAEAIWGDQCVLTVPVFVRGQFFGGIALQTQTARTLTQPELELLECTAEQVSVALERVQTSDRIEQLVAEKQRSDEANQAKSQFLSVMNHELRTPLTSIIGFSNLLMEEIYGSLNQKQMQYVSAILESGEYLLELINDLLDISKIEAEKEELFLEKVPVEEICLSSLSLVAEKARQEGLRIEVNIAPNVGVCLADQRRLKQILVNLLSNSVKFTSAGGSVTLQVQQDTEIRFSIIDTGIGISPEDQQKLFQPFVQINNRFSRKQKGTGLGLALSRKLAQLHGGDITLVSEVGKGSCFTLHLPL
ncbi:MAG: ATP-binding protein [Cyanophyceae cyanobacterium]